MDLNRLRSFYYAAKHLSISKAAHEIGVNQPAISKHIMALEEELSCHLVDRLSRKGLVLTDKGRILYESSKKIMYEADIATKLLTVNDSPVPQGPLKLATTLGFFTSRLMDLVPEFTSLYPNIQLSIVTHDDLDLDKREADVAVRSALPNHPDLIQIPLGSFTYRLFASKKYIAEFGTPKSPQDLDHHRLICFSRDQASAFNDNRWVLSLGRERAQPRSPYYEVNVGVGIVSAVESGLGIAAIPRGPLNSNPKDQLVNVLPDYIGGQLEVCIVFPKRLKFAPNILALSSFLEERIKA